MSGGFGRKGLEQYANQGSAQALGPIGIDALRNGTRPHQRPMGNDITRKVDAFVAAERAQRSQEGVSDAAAGHRDSARPVRSLMLAYLLWFILGQVSAHRFYLGAYRSAVAQVGLLAVAVIIAINRLGSSNYALGVLMAVAMIGWALWVLGDVFFIHRIHRQLCRKPGDAATAFA